MNNFQDLNAGQTPAKQQGEKKRVGRVKGTPNKPKPEAILKKYVERQALILSNAWESAKNTGRGPVVDGTILNAFYTGVIALELINERKRRDKAARRSEADTFQTIDAEELAEVTGTEEDAMLKALNAIHNPPAKTM